MEYKHIIKAYSLRKEKLQHLIENNLEIENERVLKISGAIDEISLFINFLEQYQKVIKLNQNDNVVNSINQLKGINEKNNLIKIKKSLFN
jgi:hypothetical protein